MTLFGLLTAVVSAGAAAGALASAKGNVIAQRLGDGPFQLRFNAGGTPTKAHGHFTYREPAGYTVRGKVTCYHQESGPSGGNRAVFTGPVTNEKNPDNNTESFVVWVNDDDPTLGSDAFDVAGGGLLGPECAQNFPLDRFDDPDVRQSLYYVTSGNIRIR